MNWPLEVVLRKSLKSSRNFRRKLCQTVKVATHNNRLFLFGGADEKKTCACVEALKRNVRLRVPDNSSRILNKSARREQSEVASRYSDMYVLEFEQMLWVELTSLPS